VYWGTFERKTGLTTDQPDSTAAYRDRVIKWVKDLRRSIDWAETRDDLDMQNLGFNGFSWGARLGPLLIALEPRIRAAVLNVGGLKFQGTMPEADPFHYAPRVRIPVLMLNGELDQVFPLETSSKPLFEILGTADSLKQHVIEEGGHVLRGESVIRETLAWFDRFLGPV
jgi:dienelactone hydrolase